MSNQAIPLPYLLAALHRAEFTGRLDLRQGDLARTVLLHGGAPVHVRSRLQEETLGRILLDEGRLSIGQYDQMLAQMAQVRRPAGEVLISMGVLGPQDVFNALEFQTRKKLTNSFRMLDFEFSLHAETIAPELLITHLDMAEVVLAGILNAYSVDRLLTEFAVDEETVFIQVRSATKRLLRIGPKEQRLLRELGTGTALAKLMAGGQDLRYLLAVLYSFHALGLLEASGLERPSHPRLAPFLPEEPEPASARPPSQPPPEPDAGEAEDEFRPPTLARIMAGQIDAVLAEKILAMGRQDYFQLLGLDRDATAQAVRAAYQTLLKTFRLEDIDGSYRSDKDRELARRLLDLTTMAQRVLRDPAARQIYLQDLEANTTPEQQRIAPRILADVEAQKGLLAMRNKRWSEAKDQYDQAIALYPDEPSYYFQLGKLAYMQALERTPPDQPLPDSLRKPLLKALALDPRYDQPRLYLGYLAKRNGNFKAALREFEGALECNPHNRVAQSEIRLLRRRLREQEA
jgi:hypothetical protein